MPRLTLLIAWSSSSTMCIAFKFSKNILACLPDFSLTSQFPIHPSIHQPRARGVLAEGREAWPGRGASLPRWERVASTADLGIQGQQLVINLGLCFRWLPTASTGYCSQRSGPRSPEERMFSRCRPRPGQGCWASSGRAPAQHRSPLTPLPTGRVPTEPVLEDGGL